MSTNYYVSVAEATNRSTGISGATVSSGSSVTGSVIDNATNMDAIADIGLTFNGVSAPGVGKTARLWLRYSQDGGSTFDTYGICLLAITLPTNTSVYRYTVSVDLLPLPFVIVFENVDGGVNISVTVTCKTRKFAKISNA